MRYSGHQVAKQVQLAFALECVVQPDDEGVVHGFQDQSLGEGVDPLLRRGYRLFEYDFHGVVAVQLEFDVTFDIVLDHENLAECPSAKPSNNFEVSDGLHFFLML